jgi:transcriptional regulator with XRE-family HTH domain
MSELSSRKVGPVIAQFRKVRNIKAIEVADQLGLSEAAYTKYERGETAITVDFIQRVAKVLQVDPILLLTTSPSGIIDAFHKKSKDSYHKELKSIAHCLENLVMLNQKLIALISNQEQQVNA